MNSPEPPKTGRIRELERKLRREAGWLRSRRTSPSMRSVVARAMERHQAELNRLTTP